MLIHHSRQSSPPWRLFIVPPTHGVNLRVRHMLLFPSPPIERRVFLLLFISFVDRVFCRPHD
jgi:hypothetical protein